MTIRVSDDLYVTIAGDLADVHDGQQTLLELSLTYIEIQRAKGSDNGRRCRWHGLVGNKFEFKIPMEDAHE
jgi:hypothetical protein